MPITLRQLQIFTEVVKHGSVTAAADNLHISQSSISRHLISLEDELGQKLYHSSGTGIELTRAGKLVSRRATLIIDRIKNAEDRVRGMFAETRPAAMTIGASYTAATTYVPLLLRRFQDAHSHVTLRLRTANGWVLARLILKGEVDIALVHSRPTYKQLHIEPFSTDPATAFIAASHPLAEKARPSLEEMNEVGFVLTASPSKLGVTRRFLDCLKRKGLKPNIALRCDSEETKNAAVKSWLGIGLGFRAAIEQELKRGEFVELPLPGLRLSGNSYMIYHKKRPLTPAGLEFIGMLRKYRSRSNRT